jgi:hypothetical protein
VPTSKKYSSTYDGPDESGTAADCIDQGRLLLRRVFKLGLDGGYAMDRWAVARGLAALVRFGQEAHKLLAGLTPEEARWLGL